MFNRFGVFPVCVISIFSDVDEYGFKRDATFNPKIYENFTSSYYSVLTKRRMKWQAYMKKPHILQNNKSAKLKRYVRKGIPGNVFGIAFNAVCVLCVRCVYASAATHIPAGNVRCACSCGTTFVYTFVFMESDFILYLLFSKTSFISLLHMHRKYGNV